MLKAVVAATAAVTIATTTLAYAQRDDRQDGRRWRPTTEDIRAFQAARLAALRAGLTLNADQERYWPAFEQAMRDLQQFRLQRLTALRDARREGRPPVADPAERMRERANRLSEGGVVLKRLAEATEPLYRSLDEAQKRRFTILTRTEGPRGWQRRGREGGEHGMPRGGHRRTDIAPDAAKGFAHKTVDRDTFVHTFASKTVDGVMVGRVFGAKTVNGDLAIGEGAFFAGKSSVGDKSEPGAFTGKFIGREGAGFSREITIGEPPVFGRKAVASI
jgi:zinc resistance-associated protein